MDLIAWTSPMTFVSGTALTAAQLNTNLRDNLNQTGPALVSVAGQILVSTGANALAARTPVVGYNSNLDSYIGTSFGDITSYGPAATATTGTQALIGISAQLWNSNAAQAAFMGYAVSSATTITPSDDRAVMASSVNPGIEVGSVIFQTGLTAGSNVVTTKYRVTANTGTAVYRRLWIQPY